MRLTGPTLEMVVIAAALAAFVATVWVWPRLSRRGWTAVTGRVGVLVGCQLMTIVAMAVLGNNYFGFYSTWSDLLGTNHSGAVIVPGPQSPMAGGRVRVVKTWANSSVEPGVPASAGGTIEQVEITGAATGLTVPAYVYLPAQYGQPSYARSTFPVMVVLTGYPGAAENLITRMKYPTFVARETFERKLEPTILVMIRPTVAPPRDTECQDVPHGPRAETFFTSDLHRAMATTYRVADGAARWGVIGDSTGGYCALKLAMRHPESYSAAVSLSGYYKSAVDVTTGNLFGGDRRLRDENDLLWRLANLPAPPVSVLVTSSPSETDFTDTQAFVAAIKPPMLVWRMYLQGGGHNFATWDRELPGALQWLGERLSNQHSSIVGGG